MDISYNLRGIDFEWDEAKAAANFSKHKISFETACEVFGDPFLVAGDVEFIEDEERQTVIGASANLRLIYLAYTIRGNTIRIISARSITGPERNSYENR
ncbi:MAG: BrnT family toxin [Pyrinomonadaceae bacterium]